MSGSRIGRPWNAHEDELLIKAVAIHGDNTDRWKTIALSVPGRTNKACRKRWLHSLSPSVKKSAWTKEEDQLLVSLYDQYPNKWAVIARYIPGRTDDACSKRYREALDPSLKKDDWSSEEDAKLLDLYATMGGKWGQVGQALGRSGLGCRNRWRLLERRRGTATCRQIQDTHAGAGDLPTPLEPTTQVDEIWHAQPAILGNPDQLCDMVVMPVHEYAQFPIPRPVNTSPTFDYTPSLSSALGDPVPNRLPTVDHQYAPLHEPLDEVDNSPSPMEMPIHDDMETTSPDVNDVNCVSAQMQESEPPSEPITMESVAHDTHSPRTWEVTSAEISELPIPSGSNVTPETQHVVDNLAPQNNQRTRKRPRTLSVVTDRPSRIPDPPRLSSKLPVIPGSEVLAYACGHRTCWCPDASASSALFATSGELSEHYKYAHVSEHCNSRETPFRCGLEGCRKSWKSINGLQYHLQVSKAHFRQALSTYVPPAAPQQPDPSPTDPPPVRPARKLHPCPHPNCHNQYKQLSGLRYHLDHGHPSDLPTQLDIVPPTLARRICRLSS